MMIKATTAAFFLLFMYGNISAQERPKVPLMRQIFHENIDRTQTTIDLLDGKKDRQVTLGNNEEVNLQLSYALINKVDGLQDAIELDTTLDANNKIKFLRGINEVLSAYDVQVRSKEVRFDILDALVEGYMEAMQMETSNLSILPVIEKNEVEIGRILVKAFPFQRNPGYDDSRELLVLMECRRDPSMIMPILRSNPDVRFADSLLIMVARREPEEIYNYAQSSGSSLGRRINKLQDPLVKTIAQLATMNTGRMYFPFLDLLYTGQTTIDEVKKSLDDEYKYFRLLVNTQISYAERTRRRDTPMAMEAVYAMLKKKAVEDFINVINGLHDEADHIRMKKVEPLNAQELYYLTFLGENEIYTSSYLKTYARIWPRLKNPSSDSLLVSVHFDHFKKFIKMAAGYNTLDDFLKRMPKANAEVVMKSFVNGLERTGNLEDAVDVADSYASISDDALRKLIRDEVQTNLARLRGTEKRGYIIYNLLDNIFTSMDSGSSVDIAAKYGIPPIYSVKNSGLKNNDGKIIIQQFFYGDRDGMGVFNNFRNAYRGLGWKIVEKPNWIEVSSTKGVPVIIYANRALDETKGLDAIAQEKLGEYLDENSLNPTMVIHRGHSYYVNSTIKQLAPSAKVILLGSCGGYHNLNAVLETCPYAHIIASKQIGSGTVNQPMIIAITEQLRQGKDLDWPTMWKGFEKRFASNPLFNDYVPPHKNLGALFIMTYNKVMENGGELAFN